MKTYRVQFTPEESYFFGNEKTFIFPGQENGNKYNNQYYISSENVPSQSTILGAIRYLLLPVKRGDFKYTEEEIAQNAATVGAKSFNINSTTTQDWGIIKSISPVFLTRKNNEKQITDYYVVTPKDHMYGKEKYTPFSDYLLMQTENGEKLFAQDYNVKNGLDNSYINLRTYEIVSVDALFAEDIRVGINRQVEDKGLFKKVYKKLSKDYSFGVYLEIDETSGIDMPSSTEVFLGQNKSLFHVDCIEEENKIEQAICACLEQNNFEGMTKIYFWGDTIAHDNFYENTHFAIVGTKDYRSFMRNFDNHGRVVKGSELFRLVEQGSVILTRHPEEWLLEYQASVPELQNAQKIGYCKVLRIGGR